jgi:hypothetical protein
MVFSSLIFLSVFLPAVLALYAVCGAAKRNAVLPLASLFFYRWGEPGLLWVLLISIVFTWMGGRAVRADTYKKFYSNTDLSSILRIDTFGDVFLRSDTLPQNKDVRKAELPSAYDTAIFYDSHHDEPHVRYYVNGKPGPKPLLVGDSFGDVWSYDLARHFAEVMQVNINLTRDTDTLLRRFFAAYYPDYFVFVAYSVPNMVRLGEKLPTLAR